MPEESAGDRTEEATPRRREKERERGRVAKSRDLSAASVLLGGMIFLKFGGETIYRWLFGAMEVLIGKDMGTLPMLSGQEIVPFFYKWLEWTAFAMLPFAVAVFVVSLAVNLMQVGFLFTLEPLMPNLSKLNPVNGIKRMFGLRSLVTLGMNLLKLGVVILVSYLTFCTEFPGSTMLAGLEPGGMLIESSRAVYTLGVRLAMVFFILGVADMAYQMYQQNADMKMTKQEVKEEIKEMDGDPMIRAKRRQIQRQMAMQRMMAEVPEAEVVVRNPTHFAVAIKYKPGMVAPTVIAKGADNMAKRIIEIAIENGVPVWQQPPLARQLFKVELGDPIPPALFPAVAEVIAHVMQGEKRAEYLRSMGAA